MTASRDHSAPPYSLLIQWDPRDDIFVVTVLELPGCRTHGRTYEEAVQQARDAIATWLDGAREDGETLPAPRTYPAVTAAMIS